MKVGSFSVLSLLPVDTIYKNGWMMAINSSTPHYISLLSLIYIHIVQFFV
jgi:hypothetical protein